jgi:L-seryl-tRNA(Ser) seleniumtransferase
VPTPNQNRLRQLPKVDSVLLSDELGIWRHSSLAVDTIRELLDETRRMALEDENTIIPDAADLARQAYEQLEHRFKSPLRRVINGTGVVIHTNLGRSPLSEAAIMEMNAVARGYSTLEYDLDRGRRGSRHNLVRESLLALTGAEDALVTNNNASALLLALMTLAKRKEVVVSRGQLVEIGGSFRIPDICKVSGAKLVEVGTTNRTRKADYRNAISAKTGILLRVHPSNFRVIGFTEETGLADLVSLGKEFEIPVVDDLGSGALVDVSGNSALPPEQLVRESVDAGVDVVTFSGDKLLGGPQAGIAVGKSATIAKMRKHPLMRAIRPDKLTFAALSATLRDYLTGSHQQNLPVWRMFEMSVSELEEWLKPVCKGVESAATAQKLNVSIQPSTSYAGGGSLPEEELPSRALVFTGSQGRLKSLQTALRLADVPVIGYLKDGGFHLDARTLSIESRDEVIGLLRAGLEDAE